MFYLFAIGIVLVGWQIIVGISTGKIAALGHFFVRADRDRQPLMFWSLIGLNTFWMVGFGVLMIHELHP